MVTSSAPPESSWSCHWRYWILPSLVVGTMMALYFSGVPLLQSIAAPHINRELGAVESIQHLILLVLTVLNVRTALSRGTAAERALWWVISAGTLFMLLEELDYGQHYLEFLRGVPLEQRSTLRSLHDGANTQRLKLVSDITDIVFFLIFSIAARGRSEPWVQYLRPSIYSVGTVLASFVLARTAHALDHFGFGAGGALYSGLAEFREIFIYWLWFLYFGELRRRSMPPLPW